MNGHRVRVKICGLTRREDVREAVRAGADALGFVFAPGSPRRLEVAQALGLVTGAPAFVSRVGLFLDQDAEAVARVLDRVPLNLLQFHGAEDADFCAQFGLPYIKALSMQSGADLGEAAAAYADASGLLLDGHAPGSPGGTGRAWDWSLVRDCRLPLIIAGGLTPENVAAAVRQIRPWAVDVSSGVESAPGVKDRELLRKFIDEAQGGN